MTTTADGEREELCDFISLVLEDAGIDPEALATRRGSACTS